MSFSDIFRKSFLEGYYTVQLTPSQIVIALLFAALLGLYIFFCYRVLTRKTFYSKNFNISLVALALITTGIILTVQSNVVISLGMVGALSIVRFRTAIKDPMDLVFLFWSIGIGIICGAGLVMIAILMSLAVTVLVLLLDRIPVARAPMILVVNASGADEVLDRDIEEIIGHHAKSHTEKSRSLRDGILDLVVELRIADGRALVRKLEGLPAVTSVSLLSHDGEVTF